MNHSTIHNESFIVSSTDQYTITKDYIVLGLYLIVAILALISNSFVLYVIFKTARLKTSTTFLILANLAAVDCLGGVAILLQFCLCHHHFLSQGDQFIRACGLSKSLQILSYYVSSYSMLFISLDRYLQLKYRNNKNYYFKPVYAIGLSWLIGGLFNATTFVNLRINEYFRNQTQIISCRIAFIHSNLKTITFRKVRIALLISTQYLVPLIITAILYYKIWKMIEKNSKESVTMLNQKQIMFQIQSKKRIIIMLIAVVAAFAIAWLPVHIIHFINFFIKPLVDTTCNSSTIYVLAYWFGVSSICFNPLIYYWSNSIFRDEFMNLLYKLKLFKNQTKIQEHRMDEIETTPTSIARNSDSICID